MTIMRFFKILLSTFILSTAFTANAGLTFSGLTNAAINIKPDSNLTRYMLYIPVLQ